MNVFIFKLCSNFDIYFRDQPDTKYGKKAFDFYSLL